MLITYSKLSSSNIGKVEENKRISSDSENLTDFYFFVLAFISFVHPLLTSRLQFVFRNINFLLSYSLLIKLYFELITLLFGSIIQFLMRFPFLVSLLNFMKTVFLKDRFLTILIEKRMFSVYSAVILS